jgi:phosphatidylserine decarboxylase
MLRIVSDGINYACGLTLAGLILSYFFSPYLGVPLYVIALFCLWFFRDPERKPPAGDVMVAPADGKVVSVKSGSDEPARVSIFLNIFNVHVARSPVAGRIRELSYTKGKFRVASLEAASLENEKSTFDVDANGSRVVFSLIAGLIARRIVTYKRSGETLGIGERVGLMKFGSRVDVFMGPEWTIAVRTGQKVTAGVTVIARRSTEDRA